MGQAKQRGTYEERVAQAKKEAVHVMTPNGSTTFDTIEDWQNSVLKSLEQGANALIQQMSGFNMDLTLLDKPTFQPKDYRVGGKQFGIDIHCNNHVSDALANSSKQNVKSVIQLWNGSKSINLIFTAERLADACLNWRGENRIDKDNILSQTVSALRLMSQNPAIHHIAMYLAYEHKEMDAGGIHAVWD